MNSSLYTYLCEDIYAHINLIKDLEDKKLHKNISLKNLKTIKKSDKIESFMDVSINILEYLESYDKIIYKPLNLENKKINFSSNKANKYTISKINNNKNRLWFFK